MNNPIDYWYKKYLNEKQKNENMIDKACNFFYEQLNNGIMECGDIETFINDFKKAMEE